MTVTVADRNDFTLDTYRRVAWEREPVEIADPAIERMRASRSAFMELIEDESVVVYGVTSGYGQHANLRFTREERERHARRPLLASAVSFGDPFPERITRGIVFARLLNFVSGFSAITPDLAVRVAAMLDGGPLPEVPVQGNGGAGEIVPLGHLFSPLSQSVELREKDALCLVNGSPCATAVLADAALTAARRVELAADVFALAWDAFKAPAEHLDAALADLWGDHHEAAALAMLRDRIDRANGDRRPYQAPVSFRILPRYLGRALRATTAVHDAAGTALRAVTDNPVFIPPDAENPRGRVASTGGYHNAAAAPALDELAATWADLCLLAERQSAKILDGRISGLPDQLRREDGDQRYLGCSGMAAVGFGERARHFAQRTFLPGPESGGYGQNDVATTAIAAWEKQHEAGRALDACLAILAVVSAEALAATERPPPPPLSTFLTDLRRIVPELTTMRALGPDFAGLRDQFDHRIHASAVGR